LEWKIIYVGSAESEDHDQVLDTIYVGPVPEGRHMFMFQVIFLALVGILVCYIEVLKMLYVLCYIKVYAFILN
jgi:hypothetical protein